MQVSVETRLPISIYKDGRNVRAEEHGRSDRSGCSVRVEVPAPGTSLPD